MGLQVIARLRNLRSRLEVPRRQVWARSSALLGVLRHGDAYRGVLGGCTSTASELASIEGGDA